MSLKIYVASSWRNKLQPDVVALLRDHGHEVYDFRNPSPSNHGFSWSEIDPNWKDWSTAEYCNSLIHPIAEAGFKSDFDAMKWADVCVLVLPCGNSAHTEAGWMQGQGKPTLVYMLDTVEPELMYKCYDSICTHPGELLQRLMQIDFDGIVTQPNYNLEYLKNKVAYFSDTKTGSDRPFTAPLHHIRKEALEAIESGELVEFADIQILLMDAYRKRFPHLTAYGLIEACYQKLRICMEREYAAPDENGVVEHIRENSTI